MRRVIIAPAARSHGAKSIARSRWHPFRVRRLVCLGPVVAPACGGLTTGYRLVILRIIKRIAQAVNSRSFLASRISPT